MEGAPLSAGLHHGQGSAVNSPGRRPIESIVCPIPGHGMGRSFRRRPGRCARLWVPLNTEAGFANAAVVDVTKANFPLEKGGLYIWRWVANGNLYVRLKSYPLS